MQLGETAAAELEAELAILETMKLIALRAYWAARWALHPDRYDDGGFSGGTMQRPALKRLMADVPSPNIRGMFSIASDKNSDATERGAVTLTTTFSARRSWPSRAKPQAKMVRHSTRAPNVVACRSDG